ncbi:MAG TPA: GNAT family N-acetyltransferase [Acidimicrobiia bacterium]|nr:GNAT family N-acetyltransferase [Acidimicrobiia bacterium]
MTRTMTCHCQAVIAAEDTESLIAPAKAHYDEEHPEYELTLTDMRNYLESEDRSTGPTERLESIGEVEVLPMGPDSAMDAIEFFDTDAFPDYPQWGACYCMFFPRGGRANENWGQEPWRENREDQLHRIRDGKTTGMLAYSGGKVVGWCNASPRAEFPGLATGNDEEIVSVVCFVIAPPYRGHGVATRLLEGVVSNFTNRGFRRLEAYPVRETGDQRKAFHGTLELFSRFGFEVESEVPLVVGLELG